MQIYIIINSKRSIREDLVTGFIRPDRLGAFLLCTRTPDYQRLFRKWRTRTQSLTQNFTYMIAYLINYAFMKPFSGHFARIPYRATTIISLDAKILAHPKNTQNHADHYGNRHSDGSQLLQKHLMAFPWESPMEQQHLSPPNLLLCDNHSQR